MCGIVRPSLRGAKRRSNLLDGNIATGLRPSYDGNRISPVTGDLHIILCYFFSPYGAAPKKAQGVRPLGKGPMYSWEGSPQMRHDRSAGRIQ